MSNDLNRVILIGHISEPKTKVTQDGKTIVNASLATSIQWQDKHTGEKVERTEWHRVVFFKNLAEVAGQHLHKGSKICVEGQLRTRKWQDKSGQDRVTTEIIAREMQMLDSPDDNTSQQPIVDAKTQQLDDFAANSVEWSDVSS